MIGVGIPLRMRQDDEGGTLRLVYVGLFLSTLLGIAYLIIRRVSHQASADETAPSR